MSLRQSDHPLLGRGNQRAKKVRGLYGAARAWYLAELAADFPHTVVVCPDQGAADEIIGDLASFTREEPLGFPASDVLPLEPLSTTVSITAQRLHTLCQLNRSPRWICVTPITSLLYRTLPAPLIEGLTVELTVGSEAPRAPLLDILTRAGYHRVPVVSDIGEFAVRGGVIDVFTAGLSTPVRLQFLGDIVDEIRSFEAESQRSQSELPGVLITPVTERLRLRDIGIDERSAIKRLRDRAEQLGVSGRSLDSALEILRTEAAVPGSELVTSILYDRRNALFDHVPANTHWVIVEEFSSYHQAEALWDVIQERAKRLPEEGLIIPETSTVFSSPEELRSRMKALRPTFIDSVEVLHAGLDAEDDETITVRTFPQTELTASIQARREKGRALSVLKEHIGRWRGEGFRIAITIQSRTRAERLQTALAELNIDLPVLSIPLQTWIRETHRSPVAIILGTLAHGFVAPNQGLVFVAEQEIFPERSSRHSRHRSLSAKRLLNSLGKLQEGDYVVHEDEGIGIYRGLKAMEIEGICGDFLHIEYANDSRLYLPIQQIAKVQKYVAGEGQKPPLDRLGSQRWVRTKAKVRQDVEALAGDLIHLYATRSTERGWRFDPSGAEDERFADTFPFDETGDQLKAIQETLGDMTSDRVMDRLICGDAGFGKTEVALRAAFKCLQHQRQVAVLAPTTVLVAQHVETFRSRLEPFGAEVASVSRFQSAADNRSTLERVASGNVDVVVGTHRLLQKDVAFRDLGLLIVDEEHRFGVKQKERLKLLKKNVEVLTLTATPIPRTLQMGLVDIRDMSIIATPPHDRQVIRTYVAMQHDSLIRDAILREVQRGGQAFYLHNRVDTIEGTQTRLQTLVPEARFCFAHGQMDERKLEEIMFRFVQREFDVLICTTIIESGLDIPNANTILIERADCLGLAQLYQLRGRVGRSDRQAYAYFLVPTSGKLSADAEKRLRALQSLDELGLGFHLAIQDLEIRGAGNLLGKEQSGNVAAVGYELYTKILRDAVQHLRGKEVQLTEMVEPEVRVPVPAFLPAFYIPDISERLVTYQRLAATRTREEVDEMAEEMNDRFGPPPPEALDYLSLMHLRVLLRSAGATSGEVSPQALVLSFAESAPIDRDRVVDLVKKQRGSFRLGRQGSLICNLDGSVKGLNDVIKRCAEVLDGLRRPSQTP